MGKRNSKPPLGAKLTIEQFQKTVTGLLQIKQSQPLISNATNPMVYQRGVFLILMIELNDLLQFLKLHGFPVNFWVVGENKTEDITDLVNNIRNAACHIRSPLRKFDPYELEYASNILGPGAMIHLIGPGVTYAISNKTVDDIGFAFGVRMIFAKADIGPAIAAARDRLYALGKANGFSTFGI